MATITDLGYPTLQNVVSRLAPNGGVEAQMAELLTKNLPLLEDMPWTEGNLPTGHRITSRTGLPSPTWRRLNQGVDPTKSTTAQYDESCGILEAYSKVDVDVAALNGNAAAFRASEDKAFLEGFSQELERAVFYENVTTNPEKIHGLSPRYSATTGITAASYVLKKGTVSGSNAHSVWLINWDPDSVFGIFPKASMAGLKQEDRGIREVEDGDGKKFEAYVTKFQWKAGLAVKDYRKVVRMQWDPDDTTTFPDTGKTFYLALQEMIDTCYRVGPHAMLYMDRTSATKLNAQLASNSANYLEYLERGGKRLPHFQGIPIRITDTLTSETAIS